MDTPDEARQIDHELRLEGKSWKPRPTAASWEELRRLNAAKDAHRDGCPMGLCGSTSTLCLCKELAAAELAAKIENAEDVCQRCRNWPKDCKCPEGLRQLI